MQETPENEQKPQNGQIWFGGSIQKIVIQRDDEGLKTPLFFERVGSNAYRCKGGRQ
jgi:hypothetical protein